jgi:hypothetical protein
MADNSNRIVVNLTTNNVVVNDTDNNQLTVVQPVTDIIQVNSLGPQGAQGSSQPFNNTSGSIWATTSSLQVTGSLSVLGNSYVNGGPVNYGFFTQIENGPIVTATTDELNLIGAGIGTLSVPANRFAVGDSFHAKLLGHLSSANNQTLRIRVKSSNVLLADTGFLSIDTTTNRHWELDIDFTIRSLGIAGVASIASGGVFTYTRNSGGGTFEGTSFSDINNTTFDTTINNTLVITAQWGSVNASNIVYSEIFVLNKTF